MKHYAHWFIRARLKTRQLLLLVAIAEEKNIHRAAESLNITQPAASKLLKDLEDVLGVSLFDRLPKGMIPTWYGEALVRNARVALSSLNQAFDEVQALKAGHLGSVNIGAITTPGITLLPTAIATLKKTHPNLHVQVHIDTSDVLHLGLAQGKHDLLVARLFAAHDKSQVNFFALADEPAVAVVRTGHPLLDVDKLSLRDLSHQAWIVPPEGTVLRHRYDLMFLGESLPAPTNLIETTAVLFITKIIVECDAICLLAADVARYYEAQGLVKVLPVHLPCEMDAFGVITRSDLALSPAAALLLGAVRREAATVYGVPVTLGSAD